MTKPKRHSSKERQRVPTRSCVGCGERTEQRELVRIVLGPDGGLLPDLGGGAFGRGAWVHVSPSCFKKAAQRGFARSFRTAVDCDLPVLFALLADGADRRIAGLLSAAVSARHAATGADAAKDAVIGGKSELCIVARDAAATATLDYVQRCIADGRAIAWGTKQILGLACGRDEIAIVALLDNRLGREIRRAEMISRLGGMSVQPMEDR